MRLLVCGSRNWTDVDAVAERLEKYLPSVIIHGGCPSGADRTAAGWAHVFQVPTEVFPANWTLNGKAAGPIRNRQMLEEGKPDLVLAFGTGKGTDGMVRLAEKAGIPVERVPKSTG